MIPLFSSPTRSAHCEYVEEFPVQALPQFSSLSGHKVSEHGLLVLVMQYGKKKIDYLGRSRAETDWTKAWRSNFLHPVLYFYEFLPTGELVIPLNTTVCHQQPQDINSNILSPPGPSEEDLKLRPPGWPLPRPAVLHHMVEDFLTEWDAPVSHVQPLRRFLERCVRTDLRAFYAGEAADRAALFVRVLRDLPVFSFIRNLFPLGSHPPEAAAVLPGGLPEGAGRASQRPAVTSRPRFWTDTG